MTVASPPQARLAPGCAACGAEVMDPLARRFRYAFATCEQCEPGGPHGPPSSEAEIARWRARFPPCPTCESEAELRGQKLRWCHACGPRPQLQRRDGRASDATRYTMLDDVDAVGGLIIKGESIDVETVQGGLRVSREYEPGAASFRGARSNDDLPSAPSVLLDLATRRVRTPVYVAPVRGEGTSPWRLVLTPEVSAADEPIEPIGTFLLDEDTHRGELRVRLDEGGSRRIGALKPVACASRLGLDLLRGHLLAEMGAGELSVNHPELPFLSALLDVSEDKRNAPPRSSLAELCGAAWAAIEPSALSREVPGPLGGLETLLTAESIQEVERGERYPTAIPLLPGTKTPYLEPLGMWRALLGDLAVGEDRAVMASRFFVGVLDALALLAQKTGVQRWQLVGPAFDFPLFREGLSTRLSGLGHHLHTGGLS